MLRAVSSGMHLCSALSLQILAQCVVFDVDIKIKQNLDVEKITTQEAPCSKQPHRMF